MKINLWQRLTAEYLSTQFTDVVNGRDVNLYRTRKGQYFLAHSTTSSLFFYVIKSHQ